MLTNLQILLMDCVILIPRNASESIALFRCRQHRVLSMMLVGIAVDESGKEEEMK